jgi:hypothetical protein
MMGLSDRFGGGKDVMQQKMVQRVLDSEAAEAVLTILARTEHRLLTAVVEQHDLLGLDGPAAPLDPEERAERLRGLWEAKMAGEFPAFWVEHYADLDNPEEAAQFAAVDPEEWQTTKREWADRLRRNGLEGDTNELAEGHVRKRYGVGLAEFERVVVEWPDGRASEELQAVLAGPVETAVAGIERANDHLRDREA